MYQINGTRRLSGLLMAGLVAVTMFLGTTIFTGCADNTVEPASSDTTPVGFPGTVKISDPVSGDEANSVRTNVERNSADTNIISPSDVVVVVLNQNPGAEVLGVNYDFDRDSSATYECVIRQNGKVYVIVVSPNDGKVIEKKEIHEYYYPTVIVIKPTTIKIKEVREKAKKELKGDVVEINLEQIDDQATYVVIILVSTNHYVTVYYDAETGKERKLKDDGECDKEKEDKHEHKRGKGHYRHGKGHGYGHHYHCHCDCDDDGSDSDSTKSDSTKSDSTKSDSTKTDSTKTGLKIISRDSARVIASKLIDSAQVMKIELVITDDSTARYEIDMSRDSNRYEATLDARTGALMEIKQTAGDFSNSEFKPTAVGDSLVPLSIARTAALAQVVGNVQMWKLEHDATGSKWMYTFEIKETATGNVKQVEVDAKTGIVTKVS